MQNTNTVGSELYVALTTITPPTITNPNLKFSKGFPLLKINTQILSKANDPSRVLSLHLHFRD